MSYRIAVYGTLKKGYGLHDYFLKKARYKGEAVVNGYTLYASTEIPAATPRRGSRILTEVYEVPERIFMRMNELEVGSGYDLVSVDTKFGPATMWAWLSPPPGWARILPNKDGVENWER